MKLCFDVAGAAPGYEQLQRVLERKQRLGVVADWALIVAVVGVGALAAAQGLCLQCGGQQLRILSGVGLAAAGMVMLAGGVRDYARRVVQQLQTLPPDKYAVMLGLCGDHPALEAYRTDVVSQGRAFVVAEFEMAKSYAQARLRSLA